MANLQKLNHKFYKVSNISRLPLLKPICFIMIEVYVIDNQEIAQGTYILTIPKIINFTPGQVISIQIDGYQPRLYSIASGDKDSELRILYDIKADGQVTPLLKNFRKGDTLTISDAFGNFIDDTLPGYWIAAGTGIAPFYAMFKSGLGKSKTLIHGGRNKEAFYYQEEFLPFFKDRYIRCCSQEAGPSLYHGRLTQFLAEQNFLPANQKYYLCGSAEMVVETRDILISKNIPFANIVAEIYF